MHFRAQSVRVAAEGSPLRLGGLHLGENIKCAAPVVGGKRKDIWMWTAVKGKRDGRELYSRQLAPERVGEIVCVGFWKFKLVEAK
jgi:hypothetical protein